MKSKLQSKSLITPEDGRPFLEPSVPIRGGDNLSPQIQQRPRNRALYALLALAVIAAGLLWRSGFISLPQWLSNNGGDALWALMVFFGAGFLFPRLSTPMIALLALVFAWSVEFSQLYRAPWIDAVRATIPGKLVLGNTFHWPDLPAYAVGIALGALAEWKRWSSKNHCPLL